MTNKKSNGLGRLIVDIGEDMKVKFKSKAYGEGLKIKEKVLIWIEKYLKGELE